MITKFLHWLRWQRFLLWKETSVLLKERKSRFILIVPLFVQVFLFAYAATFDLKYVPFVLIDESNSKYSREIVATIEASHIFTLYAKENNPAELKELISPRKAMMAIHFQSDFASQIAQGTPAKIQVILDGRNSTTASLAAAELSQIISSYAKENLQIKPALEFENRAWYNPNLLTRWNFVTALCGTLSFIQVLMLSGLSVAREREQGNFDQLLVTPYSPAQILLAKATPPIIIGLLQAILVCIIAVLWFNIPFRGNFFLMFLGLLCFTASSVGIGLAISSMSKNMQQAIVFCFVFIIPMVILSGLVSPVENMPPFFQYITYLNPLRYALEVVHSVYLADAGIGHIKNEIIPMLIIAGITMPLAAWAFRRQL